MSKESVYFELIKLDGKHDSKKIKSGLATIPGIFSVSVNEDIPRVAVDYDTTGVTHSLIEKHLNKLGFDIKSDKVEDHIM